MYGMIPKANIDDRLKAPPKKVSNKPNIPPAFSVSKEGSIPGSVTYDPNLKMIKNPNVFKILVLSSSMEKIFCMV